MARWLTASLLVLAACGNPSPPAEPRSEAARVPFAVVPERYEIDPYPGGAEKDIGVAFIQNAPLRRPEQRSLDHALAVFSSVPLTRFQREVAPVVEKELRLPFDTAVVWQRASSSVVHALVVSKQPLATFEDIVSAEPSEWREHLVEAKNGKLTESDSSHAGVQVTLGSAAAARIATYAEKHPEHRLAVTYDGWAAAGATAEDAPTFQLRFWWLYDETAEAKAAQDFIAQVRSRRPRQ